MLKKKIINLVTSIYLKPIRSEFYLANCQYNFSLNFVFVVLIIQQLFKIVLLLIAIAFLTLAERKIMASVQRRLGPNVNGIFGILQPVADGLKLLTKEMIIPSSANSKIFLFAPMLILLISLSAWSVISFGFYVPNNIFFNSITSNNMHVLDDNIIKQTLSQINQQINFYQNDFILNVIQAQQENFLNLIADINYGIFFLLIISSINVYGIIVAGWASNSKYAFLGALRSSAQMISYEVIMGITILPVILLSSSLNLTKIMFSQSKTIWYVFPLLPSAICFLIAMLAETNRTPFDLTEAEAELVAGYNTEYSSIIFAMFFLAEYSNIILMSAVFSTLFLGGAPVLNLASFINSNSLYLNFSFVLKILIICLFFICVRASYPRYRYDQLMNLGWKIILPIVLSYTFFTVGILLLTDSFNFVNEITVSYHNSNIN